MAGGFMGKFYAILEEGTILVYTDEQQQLRREVLLPPKVLTRLSHVRLETMHHVWQLIGDFGSLVTRIMQPIDQELLVTFIVKDESNQNIWKDVYRSAAKLIGIWLKKTGLNNLLQVNCSSKMISLSPRVNSRRGGTDYLLQKLREKSLVDENTWLYAIGDSFDGWEVLPGSDYLRRKFINVNGSRPASTMPDHGILVKDYSLSKRNQAISSPEALVFFTLHSLIENKK